MTKTALFDLDEFDSLASLVAHLNALPIGVRHMLAGQYAYEGASTQYGCGDELRNDYRYGGADDFLFKAYLNVLQDNGCHLDRNEPGTDNQPLASDQPLRLGAELCQIARPARLTTTAKHGYTHSTEPPFGWLSCL